MTVGTVYALTCSCDPSNYRYVGQTAQPLSERLYMHLYEAKYYVRRNSEKMQWIRRHVAQGHTISIQALYDVTQSPLTLDELELATIKQCRKQGHDLTNSLDRPNPAGPHVRWHVKRGIVKPGCVHCR